MLGGFSWLQIVNSNLLANISKIFETCKSFLPAELLIAYFETLLQILKLTPIAERDEITHFKHQITDFKHNLPEGQVPGRTLATANF